MLTPGQSTAKQPMRLVRAARSMAGAIMSLASSLRAILMSGKHPSAWVTLASLARPKRCSSPSTVIRSIFAIVQGQSTRRARQTMAKQGCQPSGCVRGCQTVAWRRWGQTSGQKSARVLLQTKSGTSTGRTTPCKSSQTQVEAKTAASKQLAIIMKRRVCGGVLGGLAASALTFATQQVHGAMSTLAIAPTLAAEASVLLKSISQLVARRG